MDTKLTTALLIALSVTALEAEISANLYGTDELQAAIDAESAGQNRKTALEALDAALDVATLEAVIEVEPVVQVHKVAKGKSVTTKAGIKGEGDEIKPEHFVHGADTIADLVEKGYLA